MSAAPLRLEGGHVRLVDALLEEQQQLTAVERFAQHHADAKGHLQRGFYEDLLPGRLPGQGEQLAFRVDMDACSGCKACVTACHSLNGLDEGETWRRVGLITGGEPGAAYQQVITTACHHCEDPECLSGCPVMAYEKDPVTGIVRHLDDQCIGCQYCVLKCPYEVPRYNAARGIVRKCDMCAARLSADEAPACVQGCPNGAISITIVEQGGERDGSRLLPIGSGDMPESDVTRPTTRYVGRRAVPPNARPADVDRIAPADAHTPLAVMLVLSQLAAGVMVLEPLAALWLRAVGVSEAAALRPVLCATAAAIAVLAGLVAVLHLGRPWLAYRAFLGLRTSWMSREVVALGLFSGSAVAYAASYWISLPAWIPTALAFATPVLGLVTLFCSAMIYADTHHVFWSTRRTTSKFLGSALVLAPAGLWGLVLLLAGPERMRIVAAGAVPLALLVAGATVVKLAVDVSVLRWLVDTGAPALARTARLLVGPLRSRAALRVALGLLGGLALPVVLASTPLSSTEALVLALFSFATLLAGELMERHLFFAGVASRAMPGA